MPQKLSVCNFEWIKDTSLFNEDFIKKCNEQIDKGNFLEIDVKCLEKLLKIHNDLPFLPERMKIEKVENLVANLHHKTECIIHTTNLKQALNHRLVFEKFHRVTKFNQNAWLKPYNDTNKDLKKQ